MNRLTLNIGARWDRYVGTLPEQSNPAGRFVAARSIPKTEVINQNIGVWRAGRRLRPDRHRPHGAQGQLQPLRACRWASTASPASTRSSNGSRTCPWTDPNGDGRFQESEVNVARAARSAAASASRYADGIALALL